MVRLVPNFASAEAGLQRILGNQRIQDRKLVTVEANQMWPGLGRQSASRHAGAYGSQGKLEGRVRNRAERH